MRNRTRTTQYTRINSITSWRLTMNIPQHTLSRNEKYQTAVTLWTSSFKNLQRKKKTKLRSSSVGRATNDGTSYLTINEDGGSNATHLKKMRYFNWKNWLIYHRKNCKHADVRVKYYNNKKNKNNHHQLTRKLVHSKPKEISSAPNLKKYHFNLSHRLSISADNSFMLVNLFFMYW